MSIAAIVIAVGLGVGWLITDSDGKIGDTRVTSGKGSFFGKLILIVVGIPLFLILVALIAFA